MSSYGRRARNARKLEILKAFAAVPNPGWISAPNLRWRQHLPIGRVALYRRLAAYLRWHLVERTQGVARLLFRITDKSRERLAWLAARARRPPIAYASKKGVL